jgi:hypothetical protein
VVSDVRSRPLNAVKALAGESQVALVISRVKDHRHGWTCTRTYYRRIRRAP